MAKKGPRPEPPQPPSVPAAQGADLLRRQREKGQKLLANRPISSAAERAWETITRDILEKAFGIGASCVQSVMDVGRYRNAFGGGSEPEWEQGRVEDMEERLTIISELIELLELHAGSNPTAAPPKPVNISADVSKNKNTVNAFISYSWDSESHKLWVRSLADDLIRNGVETILDQYDLPLGGDRFRFMEEGVRVADVVLCVCTPDYVERANYRAKGVGVETSLITPQFFDEHRTKQFIPIIRVKKPGMPPTPDYMRSLIFVDFSKDEDFAAGMEDLLRHLHQQPKVRKPSLGPVPTFAALSVGSAQPGTGTTSISDILSQILRSSKSDWQYFDERGLLVLKANPEIVVKRRVVDYDSDRFHEAWTESFPDPSAYRSIHEVQFKGTPVQEVVLVSVDGGRLYLPLPQTAVDLTITSQQYEFGKLINHFTAMGDRYDEYLDRAGITVKG